MSEWVIRIANAMIGLGSDKNWYRTKTIQIRWPQMWRTRRLGFHLTSTLRSRSCPGHVRKSQSFLGSQVSCFRPLTETGQVIKFRKSSMFAFNEMVRYMHGVGSLRYRFGGTVQDGRPCWDLPGLSDIIVECARTSIIKIQIARLTVNFHMHNTKTFKTNLYWVAP